MGHMGEMAATIGRTVVVIPAHDERDRIAACVGSVIDAARATGLPTEIRVVLDACTDGTAEMIPAGSGEVGVVKRVIDARNVGVARATGVDPRDLRADVWLAHTDADTIVDAGWLAAQLAHVDVGADAVVGTIGVADWEQRPGPVRPLFEKLYQDEPGHGHVHGANLGVRGSAYGRVGGFRPLAESEDVDLVARLVESGARVARVSDCRVVTSARVSRRTGGGMSGYLDALSVDGAPTVARESAPALRGVMGMDRASARVAAERRLSVTAMAERYDGVYRRIVDEFRDRHGRWPMEGWLRRFEEMGLVRRDGGDWVRAGG